MSPASKRAPKAANPWQRAEAGRYRSSDERFTLESDRGGGWFVTDERELDELGLPRTSGPFPTLAAARAAADSVRERPAEASPLAARLAEARERPEERPAAPKRRGGRGAEHRRRPTEPEDDPAGEPEHRRAPQPGPEPSPPPGPKPGRRTWLDELEARDRPAAVGARRLVRDLARAGIADAEAVVRRDLLGGTPAIATRLLARDVLHAVARLENPSAAVLAAAVAEVLASSPARGGLPGWELVERDGPDGQRRGLRLTADDLLAAAEGEGTG